ncbi:MAG: hypothetical protein KY469_19075, partial [Actinobacteria bacterium]|nr:hypothetical protein [Actinomycetota bacterium]
FGVVTLRPDAPAAATGVVQVGLAGGIAVGPLLFGLLAGHLDYGRSWMVVTAVMLIAAWLVFRGAVGLGHHSGSLVPLARSDG